MVPKEYYGRLFTEDQLPTDYYSEALTLKSMVKNDNQFRCKRCFSPIEEEWQLPNGKHYCRACIDSILKTSIFGNSKDILDHNVSYLCLIKKIVHLID